MTKEELIGLVPELGSIYDAARRCRRMRRGPKKEAEYIRLRDELSSAINRCVYERAHKALVDEMRL